MNHKLDIHLGGLLHRFDADRHKPGTWYCSRTISDWDQPSFICQKKRSCAKYYQNRKAQKNWPFFQWPKLNQDTYLKPR